MCKCCKIIRKKLINLLDYNSKGWFNENVFGINVKFYGLMSA